MKYIRNSRFRLVLFLWVFLIFLPVSGQDHAIYIRVSNRPLNEVLVGLRNEYSIRFSFDHQLLSSYTVTADTVFRNAGDAVNFLIKGTPVVCRKSFQTYILYPAESDAPPVIIMVSGRISDRLTHETLPYSHIMAGDQLVVSDQNGNFMICPGADSECHLTISYLGYYVLDTLVKPGAHHELELLPSRIGIENVIIASDTIRISRQVTSHPGEIRLNPQISSHLPGNGDHSLFNLLRLQPGILAAGEQSNDLIIWGSYEGQSQVLFDGLTLYGLKNFNDQISAINPLLIKDIRIIKGGFEPKYGNRIGGIVDITGYDGNTEHLHGDFIINNMTLNGMLTVPVFKRASLILAFRNTYCNLYKSMNLNLPFKSRVFKEDPVDFIVEPDYSFRDVNLKYCGTTRRGDQYNFHLLYGTDSFSYQLEAPSGNYLILDTLQERNRQKGVSGNYRFRWKSGQMTTLSASYSVAETDVSNQLEIQRHPVSITRTAYTGNQIRDLAFRMDNRIMPGKNHTLEYGTGINLFGVGFRDVYSGALISEKTSAGWLAHAYLQDRLTLSRKLILQYGIRADFPTVASKLYLQPRASLEWEVSPVFRLKTSVGKYNQFLVKSASEDDAGNIRYYWGLADNDEIPVAGSRHLTLGGYLDWPKLQFHAEAWYKTYDGITRYRAGNGVENQEILYGEGRGAGLDLYLEKQIGRHSGWIAYSLARTTERFPGHLPLRYTRAPQDQTHELKFATLFDFDPVFFSVSYVYGSGFPLKTRILTDTTGINYPYSRFDAALSYRHRIKKTILEAGLSVLNLFNTQNIKVSNFVRIPVNSLSAFNIQAEAIPFMPTIFLKFSF